MPRPAPHRVLKRIPKRILVTRSRRQTSELVTQLQALGAEPISVPTISIAPLESYAVLDAAINRLQHFHWLLFTSVNAVEFFAARAAALGIAPGSHPPKVAAIGLATAQALAGIGLAPDLLPPQAVAESLATALLPHIETGKTSMLLVRAEHARDMLPNTLRAAGAHLTIAPAYRNLVPQESIPALRSLFHDATTQPDAITFTSSSTVVNLFHLLTIAGLQLPPEGAPGPQILRFSIGPITSQTLRDLGYPPHVEAVEPTIPSLVHALSKELDLASPKPPL